ncbi:MAG: hypothetical protein ABR497_07870, partial [Kiritimatiellia bacterium]
MNKNIVLLSTCLTGMVPISDAAGARGMTLEVRGELDFPEQWTVFAPFERDVPLPERAVLATLPEQLTLGGADVAARSVTAVNSQCDLRDLLGPPSIRKSRVAYVFLPLEVETARTVTLGLGADWLIQAWINGEEVFGNTRDADNQAVERASPPFPPTIKDYTVDVALQQGVNILAVRFVSGKSSSALALGGPRELRAGNFNSILQDPFLMVRALPDESLGGVGRWSAPELRAAVGSKPPVDIGTRLELFVDDFLVEGMTGGAERRLHHPFPREVIMRFGNEGKPWDVQGGSFPSVVRDGERVLLYYRGDYVAGRRADGSAIKRETACVLVSDDGINFSRPNLGIHEFEGSTDNNIIWTTGTATHNFSVFLDKNPAAPAAERFKAIARPPHRDAGGALIGYVSPDGLHWDVVDPRAGFATPPTDSQNQGFWDPNRQEYICYMRGFPDHRGGVRDIRFSVSKDFINWSDPEYIDYTDDRLEQLYTNGIRPYDRAPHIYLGLPNRFMPDRKLIEGHPNDGINQTILMSSRDARTFDRWEEAFIRPDTDWQNWTDRSYYAALGLIQTSPWELSLYWKEHNRHDTVYLRRGTIRIDGFVSLHAGGEVGEMLTRPLIFDGVRLIVNFATSASGTLR